MDEPEILYSGKFLRFRRAGHWEFVERVNCSGVVLIVPLTDDGEIVLIEQHRVPLGASVIELPAGLVGDEPRHDGEQLETAARRELIEETGYDADRIEHLCSGPPTSGLASEVVELCRATGLTRVGSGGGVDDEQITVHIVPIDSALEWLSRRRSDGVLIDPKVYAGLYFAEH